MEWIGTLGLTYIHYWGSNGKKAACNEGDPGSTPGLERSPGEENGNPHQNS